MFYILVYLAFLDVAGLLTYFMVKEQSEYPASQMIVAGALFAATIAFIPWLIVAIISLFV